MKSEIVSALILDAVNTLLVGFNRYSFHAWGSSPFQNTRIKRNLRAGHRISILIDYPPSDFEE